MLTENFMKFYRAMHFADFDNELLLPLKKNILEKFGSEDGYDLLLLKENCPRCMASGLVVSNFSTEKIPCNDCKGKGHTRKPILLKRFYLNDILFRVEVQKPDHSCKIKETFYNPFKDKRVNVEEAMRASFILAGVFEDVIFENDSVWNQLSGGWHLISYYYLRLHKQEIDAEIKRWKEELQIKEKEAAVV